MTEYTATQATLEPVMTLRVVLGAPLPVGRVPEGELTIIPITGGSFVGPRLRGKVLPGGADWNTRLSPTLSRACARYWLQTDDGAIIAVYNDGLLDAQTKPGALCTTPRFECDMDGSYAFLTAGTYAGTVCGVDERCVEIGVWRLV
jgi:hypothetical protein